MRRLITLALGASLAGITPCFAFDATKPAAVKQALQRSPAAEMPAKAAEVVKSAKSRDRGVATENAVAAALEINPSLAPVVVAAIAKAVPEMASLAARVATERQPRQAASIAKAAALAAPSRAARIAGTVCQAAPREYRRVTLAVVQAVPGSDREVLQAVAANVPEVKPGIDAELAHNSFTPISAMKVLEARRPTNAPGLPTGPASAGPVVGAASAGPTVAAPFVPSSGNSTNVSTSNSDPVPRGGRNYASP